MSGLDAEPVGDGRSGDYGTAPALSGADQYDERVRLLKDAKDSGLVKYADVLDIVRGWVA